MDRGEVREGRGIGGGGGEGERGIKRKLATKHCLFLFDQPAKILQNVRTEYFRFWVQATTKLLKSFVLRGD